MSSITKTTKTILFASLIAAMILPFSGMSMAEAEVDVSDKIVSERIFKSDNHKSFKEYVNLDRDDNAWNNAMIKHQIRNYNIETKMGGDVDGYEILALHAQKQLMKNKQPSLATEKLFEWVLAKYDVPTNKKDIKAKLTELVGKENLGDARKLAKSMINLAEMGAVSSDIHKIDPAFWNTIAIESYCDLTGDCNSSKGTTNVSYTENATIQNTAYVQHYASIYIEYEYCEAAGTECIEMIYRTPSGNHVEDISAPGHIGDAYIYVSMTNWSPSGDDVLVRAQVTSPISGTVLVGTDDDGYVSKSGNISHPNYYAWSYPNIQWKTSAQN